MIKVKINKEIKEYEGGLALAALVKEMQGQSKMECITILNGSVVVFSKWSETIINDGDEIEVIVISSGGLWEKVYEIICKIENLLKQ